MEKRLVNKCHNYRQYCVAWINYPILRLTLIQNQAENTNKLPYKSSDEENQFEYLWNYFNSFEGINEINKLICCLTSSLQNPSFYHLGHYSLLKLLTEETRLNMLESNDYKCNLKVEEIIRSNIQQFIERINLQELLPIMENKYLLTNHDKEILNSNHHTFIAKVDFLLTKLLPTKGHCGYVLFLECLEDEHMHAGHREIVEIIIAKLHSSCICRPQKCLLKEIQAWYQPSIMNTLEYIEATEKIMYFGQNNDKNKFYNEINNFVFSHENTPVATAFGFMMEALLIKFLCQDSKLPDVSYKINQCIDCIVNEDDRRDIKGYWNIILSCWHHHKGNFQKAKSFLQKAKPELISGNNRAYVLYIEASLLIENTAWTTRGESDYNKVITLLEDAIRGFHSKSDTMSIMQVRCYMQVAHCYIGSSLRSPRLRRPKADLENANSILTMLARKLDAIPVRLQMHYYTIMCDYHRVSNEEQKALECITKGLNLDTENQFKRDKMYLQHRKRS